jgi:hypothetical protein
MVGDGRAANIQDCKLRSTVRPVLHRYLAFRRILPLGYGVRKSYSNLTKLY